MLPRKDDCGAPRPGTIGTGLACTRDQALGWPVLETRHWAGVYRDFFMCLAANLCGVVSTQLVRAGWGASSSGYVTLVLDTGTIHCCPTTLAPLPRPNTVTTLPAPSIDTLLLLPRFVRSMEYGWCGHTSFICGEQFAEEIFTFNIDLDFISILSTQVHLN